MSSLLQALLDGPSGSTVKPVKRSLVGQLKEAMRNNESFTLSPRGIKLLLTMVESGTNFKDPFSSGGSALDDGDLKASGLEASSAGAKYGIRDSDDFPKEEGGNGERDRGELEQRQPMFGPETALVAPDCTPGGREDIPDSVIHSMKIVAGEDVQEYTPGAAPAAPPATPPTPPPSPAPQGHPIPVKLPSSPQPAPSPQHESVSVLSVVSATKALRKGSAKQNSRKVIKKEMTAAERAAISKLSGPAD